MFCMPSFHIIFLTTASCATLNSTWPSSRSLVSSGSHICSTNFPTSALGVHLVCVLFYSYVISFLFNFNLLDSTMCYHLDWMLAQFISFHNHITLSSFLNSTYHQLITLMHFSFTVLPINVIEITIFI